MAYTLDSSVVQSHSDSAIPPTAHNSSHAYGSSAAPQTTETGHPSLPTSSSRSPSFMDAPFFIDDKNPQQSPYIPSTANGGVDGESAVTGAVLQTPDVDPQILEALRGKERLFVLKLAELFESLIKERRPRTDVNPATSYQRMLIHRVSAYYLLQVESDPMTKGLSVLLTPQAFIPSRRVCELVRPAESPMQPAFKIMVRNATLERRAKPTSQAGSIAGEDADLSDIEPSESGSVGGRSNITSSSNKKPKTLEEREAAYAEARSRIFMDYSDKEKGKEKDMSASSSSASLASGSGSAGGSVAETDEASSPATESEWSGPTGATKKEGKRASGNGSRGMRNFNNSGSSRNSRASSPAPFTYATLYEPSHPAGHLYDPSQPSGHPYPYPNHGPSPAFVPTYPPYFPQTYNAPPHGPIEHSINYGHPYMWPHPTQPPLPSPPHGMHPASQPHPSQPMGPPPGPAYPPYMHHPYTYPANGYYHAPPPLGHIPQPPAPMQPQPGYDMARSMTGPPYSVPLQHDQFSAGNIRGGPTHPPNAPLHSNGQGRPRTSPPNGNGKQRNQVAPTRAAWSYGPGVGYAQPMNSVGPEAIGPRLNPSRRPSSNSVSSGGRPPSTSDEVASTTSSSTSSSSRRTYTSTTSSQHHPLPPRPDWAVGLKAQPSLAGRQQDSRNASLSPRSSDGSSVHSTGGPRPSGHAPLQSNDFPPLTTIPTPEKRVPVANGAWGSSRPSPTGATPVNGSPAAAKQEGSDQSVKVGGEFNPKLMRRPPNVQQSQQLRGQQGERRDATDELAGQVGSLTLYQQQQQQQGAEVLNGET